MSVRACLLLLACACVRGSVLTAKEYICKDPDTGTLHTINSTWRSTTFCGNYICKIRKKEAANNPGTSQIIVNITGSQARVPQNSYVSHKNNEKNNGNDFSLTKILPELSKDNDRLLNTEEIRKISELLHTVKKSDLQAVIELYNVAQEMYKGMKMDEDSESVKSRASQLEDLTKNVNNKVSYWYEPMNGYRKESDMKTEGSEYKGTTTHPARSPYEQPYFYTQRNSNYPSYFSGTVLTNNDFGKLGYYHPQAHFQSLASYYQQRNLYDASRITSQTCNPCSRTYQASYPTITGSGAHYSPPRSYTENMLRSNSPSYNSSAQSYTNYNNYYKGNPWAYYDYYRNYPYPTASQVQKSPVADISPGHQTDTVNENNNQRGEDDKSWKTDPLSDEVIKEIRANVAERGKLLNIPLKKRIKLERAAKVIKLDQYNSRKIRSISAEEGNAKFLKEASNTWEKNKEENTGLVKEDALEAYIDKVTCEPDTEPGYFRVGNMTHPYPDCCPQKIEDKQR